MKKKTKFWLHPITLILPRGRQKKKSTKELTCTRLSAINKKDELLPLQWWYDSLIELIYRHLWPLDIWAPHYHGLQANQGDPRLCFWKLIPRGKHQFLQVPQAANIEPLLVEEVGPRLCRSMQFHPSHLTQQCQVCPQKMDLTQISLMLKYMHCDLSLILWTHSPEPTQHCSYSNHIGSEPDI